MIIGLCGRLRSGKGSLAAICTKYGYERIYFALPLKQLCSDLLGVTIKQLDKWKNSSKKIHYTFDDDAIQSISDRTGISIDIINALCRDKTINDARELLQFIGTDIIRKHNPDWHVNELRQMLSPTVDYVFEDVRFPNEVRFINEMGGDNWFVIRPQIDELSNHISETSLNWRMFDDKLIINDGTLAELETKWELFFSNYCIACGARDILLHTMKEKWSEGKCGTYEEERMSELLFIPKALYTYQEIDFSNIDIQSTKSVDNRTVLIRTQNGETILTNPLNIEDLKLHING